MNKATDDHELKAVFEDEDMLDLLLETGFRVLAQMITIRDKETVINTIVDYHCLIKVNEANATVRNMNYCQCVHVHTSQDYLTSRHSISRLRQRRTNSWRDLRF